MMPPLWLAWGLTAAVAAWVTAVLTAPILPAWPAAFVYAVSSLVCHQLPERSLYWGAVQFAVCARCTGIYIGAVVGTAAVAAGRPPHERLVRYVRPVLVAAAAPTAITVMVEWLGLWAPSHAVRLVAGLPLGAAVMATVAAAIVALRRADTLHYERCQLRPDEPPRPRNP